MGKITIKFFGLFHPLSKLHAVILRNYAIYATSERLRLHCKPTVTLHSELDNVMPRGHAMVTAAGVLMGQRYPRHFTEFHHLTTSRSKSVIW